jgi:hypothetical protein
MPVPHAHFDTDGHPEMKIYKNIIEQLHTKGDYLTLFSLMRTCTRLWDIGLPQLDTFYCADNNTPQHLGDVLDLTQLVAMNRLVDWKNTRYDSSRRPGMTDPRRLRLPWTVVLREFPIFNNTYGGLEDKGDGAAQSRLRVLFPEAHTLVITAQATQALLSQPYADVSKYIEYLRLLVRPTRICIDLLQSGDIAAGRWEPANFAYRGRIALERVLKGWELESITWHGTALPVHIRVVTGHQRYHLRSSRKTDEENAAQTARAITDVIARSEGEKIKSWEFVMKGVDAQAVASKFFCQDSNNLSSVASTPARSRDSTFTTGEATVRVENARLGINCQCCGEA